MDGLVDNWDPEDFRDLINTHANREYVRWWRAAKDPSAGSDLATPKYIRREQPVYGKYSVLQQNANKKRHNLQQGELDAGSCVFTSMVDELPFGYEDWIVPMGQDILPDGQIAAKAVRQNEIVARGSTVVPQTGTVSCSGNILTGTGTTFTSLHVGSALSIGGVNVIVAAIVSDTHLSLQSNTNPAWSGNKFESLEDRLLYFPTVSIDEIFDSSKTYVKDVDYRLSADEKTVDWISVNGPGVGVPYSVTYRYLPRYVVLRDIPSPRHVVNGIALPQIVLAKLWKDETHRG